MKSNYYYFIASLPHLFFSQPKPLSHEHFLSLCSSFLHANDFNSIKSISLSVIDDEAARLDSMKKWMEWDRAFRLELAGMRVARQGRQSHVEKMGDTPVALEAALAAKEVFGIASPYQADEEMDKARWDYVESLEFGRYFDMDWLALYCLKLLILERREIFDKVKGEERLQDMMAGMRENYEITLNA